MNHVQDQTGKLLSIPSLPGRIISMVPSQTELLFDLGLEQQVVGITKFCIHPAHWFRSKQRIGGTKQIHIDRIKSLQPDLVIANKEENVKEQIEEIETICPVYTSDIKTSEDAFQMFTDIGKLTGTEARSATLIQSIRESFSKLPASTAGSALYLIWRNPYMAAGNDTFISHMMQVAGFKNVVTIERYPQLDPEVIHQLKPSFIFLSSEPYPFQQKHIDEVRAICPTADVVLVNGEFFSWYGSRMLQAADYFAKLRESLFLKHDEAG